MSNDAKFWIVRVVISAIFLIDAGLLFKIQGEAMAGKAGHVTLWAAIFFVGIIATIPLGFVYQNAKRKRWDDIRKDQRQIETETLANYAKAQKPKR